MNRLASKVSMAATSAVAEVVECIWAACGGKLPPRTAKLAVPSIQLKLNILADEYEVGGLPFRGLGFEVGAHAAHDILDAAEAGDAEENLAAMELR